MNTTDKDAGHSPGRDDIPEQGAAGESAPGSQAASGEHVSAQTNPSSPESEWAQAMAEQTQQATRDSARNRAEPAFPCQARAAQPASHVFKPLDDDGTSVQGDIDLVMDIPVQLSVELGRTRMTIKNILQLGQGSVVELDGMAGEPMDIYVNGYLIAQGEVVVVDEKYGIRVTDIITPADRIARLNSRR